MQCRRALHVPGGGGLPALRLPRVSGAHGVPRAAVPAPEVRRGGGWPPPRPGPGVPRRPSARGAPGPLDGPAGGEVCARALVRGRGGAHAPLSQAAARPGGGRAPMRGGLCHGVQRRRPPHPAPGGDGRGSGGAGGAGVLRQLLRGVLGGAGLPPGDSGVHEQHLPLREGRLHGGGHEGALPHGGQGVRQVRVRARGHLRGARQAQAHDRPHHPRAKNPVPQHAEGVRDHRHGGARAIRGHGRGDGAARAEGMRAG
mmetsp:Transcript_34883/g.110191  ORF Transcript_34883/g.110191 Transcript_34883/m.110191 type:complete len:256 (-) Transcript_34883:810-1577(-)